jgi:predicted DNA-binding protein with PD1-like motif
MLNRMRWDLLGADDEQTYVLVLAPGDEIIASLSAFATERGLDAARFTAIGGLDDVTLGYFDREVGDYVHLPFQEQLEILSLVGDISSQEGGPKVHGHIVLGRRDASTLGGHLLSGRVWPTLEVMLVESAAHLHRTFDEATGLPLIDLDRHHG